MTSQHGTYFEASGTKAKFSDALSAWVPIAYEILVQTASTYNQTLTYKDLTEAVQSRSGIRTKMLISNWSGDLLEQVARRAAAEGEPPLTSLCVHQDGTIGDGYRQAPKSVSSDPDIDVEDLAAQHRLLCYQRYSSDLPADGGEPTLTRQVAEVSSRARLSATKRRDVCPIHFVELPSTGICDDC
ncbi:MULTISPECIES: hypothetical protein [Brevibacterium]|uniref:hypothetical protein n=1 Tax=Brevibacterium TaxID=1696 RepID=UPI0011BD8F4D|nr:MULTISPECIES: hypothetical protein [Brevibacterium]